MKRVVQTLGWVFGAALCVAVFVVAERWSPTPLRWRDLGGWLDDVAVEDAVVEIARWAGVFVAGYVLVVAAVVLLAELAAVGRLVSVARVLRRLGSLSAIPVLRRRLLNVTTATAITVSSLSVATSNGVAAAPAAVTETVDVTVVSLPEGLGFDAFDGFELTSAPPPQAEDAEANGVDVLVQSGDTLWNLAQAHYGNVDLPLIRELARINNIADPNLIHPGQTLHFPVPELPPEPVPDDAGVADGVDVLVQSGDTLWKLAEARYGNVDLPLIRELARINNIADPNLIYPGQTLHFPADLAPTDPPPPPPVPDDAASWAVHRVTDGETLRAIVEAHYGRDDADLVWTVAELNGITNPTDLTPGADLHLPPVDSLTDIDEAPVESPAETEPPANDEQPAESQPPDAQEPRINDESTAPPQEHTAVSPPTTVTATDAEPSGLTLAPDPPATTGEHGDESREMGTTAPGVLPWVIGGTGSLVVATGLVEWLRRRRRAKWAQSGSAWQIGPASEETPEIIADTADLPLVEWAGAALVRLMSDDPHAVVVSVELGEANLSVQWDQPRPVAPPPWWVSDDGWSWNLERSSSLRPHEDDRQVGVPGLVTFGVRDGQYLVNLEAAGSIEVDGPFTDEFVASLVVELAVGQVLSDATVQLVEMRLVGEALLDTVAIVTGSQAVDQFTSPDPSDRLLVAVVESDDPVAAELVERAVPGSRRVVIVLGGSDLPTALDVTLTASGAGELAPSGATFTAARIPAALRALDPPADPPLPTDPSGAPVEEPIAPVPGTTNVVSLNGRREQPTPPRVLLRLFAARLPALEPPVNGVGPLQMRIIAALDSFEGGRAPARIAERLGLAEKTIRTHAAPLFACDPPLVHSDREVWTLDDGVCSDVEWMHGLAATAREATARHAAVRALAECWELIERVTGPAYAGGAESKQWAWVHDHTEGPSPSDNATRHLIEAVTIAVECWDTLATDSDEGLRSAASIVQTLLRLERAIGLVEPWPLFEAAVKVARRGPESARQQIAMRLAQLAHDGELAVPDDLVAEVVG